MRRRLDEASEYLKIADSRDRLVELEAEISRPDLWDDAERAKQVNTDYANVKSDVDLYDELSQQLDDAEVLHELAREVDDETQEPEIEAAVTSIAKQLDLLELRSLFTGEHDDSACIVQINAKDGGVDAQDFAQMLLRMYARWAERKGFEHRAQLRDGGRRGGHQRRRVHAHRPLRVRPDDERARHAPAGADQPVRQSGPAPDELRRRAGVAGDGRARTSRSPTPTSAWRSSGRRAPAASTSTRRRPRCG